ncbi:5-methylcytosine restriction system specificity protein McrC [Sporobacter termitidis]|nr:hypothetical protein [Sporobacter termitidis]
MIRYTMLSAILYHGIAQQVKRGLHRDYIRNTEVMENLRGKINITDSIKRQTMITRQLVCDFDELGENTALNRILKSTVVLLLKFGDIKADNRKNLKKVLLFFSRVTTIDPMKINWNLGRFHKNNEHYKMLINICYLIIKGLLMTEEGGQYKLRHYLDDQQMNRLYEKFVLYYYRKEHPELSVNAGYINWNVDDGIDDFLPRMKSDIILSNGTKALIIDTKYYSHTTQTNLLYGSTTLISTNMYQIFTYVKNYDRQLTGDVSGLLLYAKTDEEITPNNDYIIGGNKISVKTLDLGGDWKEIKHQLDSTILLLQ